MSNVRPHEVQTRAFRMNHIQALVATVFLVLGSGTTRAQQVESPPCDFETGKKAMWADKDPEKRETGLAQIRCAAEAGSLEAQVYLATLLDAGFGVPQDTRKAAEWLERAAQKRYPPAMSRLAFAYLNGVGVRPDREKARQLLTEAAALGEVQAMANLGAMYGRGDGVPQDDRIAADWYRKAADRGSPNGQLGLANMLMRGHGVTQDYGACYMYASLAAKTNFPPAINVAKQCEQKLSAEERARITEQVLQWKPILSN
jgi:uncharacterized protein